MPLRRRAWLSREGWYYSAVLAFIVAGAILKNVNLLVALAGMMIAPLIINWRMVMESLSGLVIRRKLPEQVCAGEPITVEITAENPRRWMSSWLITVEDWIAREGDEARVQGSALGIQGSESSWVAGVKAWVWQAVLRQRMFRIGTTRASAVIAHVPAQGKAIGTYRLTLHRRGRYRFGPLRVSTRYPLGLVWGQFMLPGAGELIVAPHIGRLSPEWVQLIEAEAVGDQRRHPQRGVSEGDYYGLRPWQSGDSMRWVHWRTTAKMGRPMVRQFERRRNRDVAVLVDPWLPADFQERDEGHLELALSLAATAVADLTSRGHSRLTFAIAGAEQQCWTGPASALYCHELLSKLAAVRAADETSLAAGLEQLVAEAPLGARLVVISPRPADVTASEGRPLDLACEASDLCWIDVSSEQLGTLFSLE